MRSIYRGRNILGTRLKLELDDEALLGLRQNALRVKATAAGTEQQDLMTGMSTRKRLQAATPLSTAETPTAF
ncbi:unnamed protein product [Lasius platythorax]|uniref:Uncharacterized protein n=1 Tax=Lasius platythorax TaxID=488582 RepID=A0AAV2NKN5_9HYME